MNDCDFGNVSCRYVPASGVGFRKSRVGHEDGFAELELSEL